MTELLEGSGRRRLLLVARDRRRGNLELGDGELVMLLGASGAGKSRWLRALFGLDDRLDHVELLGRRADRKVLGASVGWVPQGDGVFLSETVWANVRAPRYVEPCPAADAADALDLVGLADRADEPVGHLGFGGRRRVALARTLARRKPILIIDGALDRTLWDLFPFLRSTLPWLRGVLVAGTVADEMAWRADSVALVSDGRIVHQGVLADIMQSRDPALRSIRAWITP
jgi:ABC-type multidrug transport system ATPase subunit